MHFYLFAVADFCNEILQLVYSVKLSIIVLINNRTITVGDAISKLKLHTNDNVQY